MRIRSVKPEFWQSESIASLDHFPRLMAIALLNLSDDHGYFNATPAVVRGEIFPFEESLANVTRSLSELSRIGYIALGTLPGGKRVGHVVNFSVHQKVDHPSRRVFDVGSIVWDEENKSDSVSPRESLASPREDLDQEHGAGSMELGAGSMDLTPPVVPQKKKTKPYPTEDEAIAHCKEHFSDWHHSSVRELFRHYVSTDWTDRDGKKIVNWKNKFSNIYKMKSAEGRIGPTAQFIREKQLADDQSMFLSFNRDMQEGIRRESERI